MTVFTQNVLALKCPECDQVHTQDISYFDFAKGKGKDIFCNNCNTKVANLKTKNNKGLSITLICAFCQEEHTYNYHRNKIFDEVVLEIYCPDNQLDICFIGSKAEVVECIKKQEKSFAQMAEELGFVEYFVNAEIMYDVLETLYSLAEETKLTCQCGKQNIQIEIMPDHLELRCGFCNSFIRIMARTESDLEYIRSKGQLILENRSISLVKNPALIKNTTTNSHNS